MFARYSDKMNTRLFIVYACLVAAIVHYGDASSKYFANYNYTFCNCRASVNVIFKKYAATIKLNKSNEIYSKTKLTLFIICNSNMT